MDDDEYGEDGQDMKGLTKKDIHTLNEQRRRDIIKVCCIATSTYVRVRPLNNRHTLEPVTLSFCVEVVRISITVACTGVY